MSALRALPPRLMLEITPWTGKVRILVTGGAGFIGSNLVKRLLVEGHEVAVIDDFSNSSPSSLEGLPVSLTVGSITDFSALRGAAEGVSAIVHLAARGSVPRSIANPRATYSVNVDGTINVMELARSGGQHVIFSSSSSVYGSNTLLPKTEDAWTRPISPYGASKLAAEATVLAYASAYGLDTLPLRFFNVYGPGQLPDHDYAAVIPKWIWAAMHGRPVEVHGDGHQTRDFTYVDTVVDILVSGLERRLALQQPINLAFGDPVSLLDLLHEIENVMGLELARSFGPPRIGDVRDSMNDPTMLRQHFPDIDQPSLSLGLQETRDFLASYVSEFTEH